jgi:ribosome biogenesis GTPase
MDDGLDVECRIKGNFRIRGIRSTNPIAVGDYVTVEDSWITDVEDRKNYIIRKSTNLSKESHILAANIDQVALIVTVNHPVTSTTFIDRFLATCEAYRVRAILIFNKMDLMTDEEKAQVDELRVLYESIGYETIELSAISLQNTEYRVQSTDLFSIFENKTTLLSGNSGVGKSTLLNALFGKEMTRTGKISDAHDKGMHTTTFSEMYFLEDANSQEPTANSRIIDTPGIKGFGTIDFEKEEVGHYFRDIFRVSRDCRFSNCTHTNEPGCAVQEAVVRGEIAVSRYESYLSLLGDCEEGKYR